MIVFIDGPQLVGKSTLIDYIKKFYNYEDVLKFEFGKFSKEFEIFTNEELRSFQIGKDFASLYYLNELEKFTSNHNFLIDRGIMSSIYYSLSLGRMTPRDILKVFDYLENFKNFKFIFIVSSHSNNKERIKKDGFDKLPKELDVDVLNFMKEECEKRNINFHIFTNDFEYSIAYNGENLEELLECI